MRCQNGEIIFCSFRNDANDLRMSFIKLENFKMTTDSQGHIHFSMIQNRPSLIYWFILHWNAIGFVPQICTLFNYCRTNQFTRRKKKQILFCKNVLRGKIFTYGNVSYLQCVQHEQLKVSHKTPEKVCRFKLSFMWSCLSFG